MYWNGNEREGVFDCLGYCGLGDVALPCKKASQRLLRGFEKLDCCDRLAFDDWHEILLAVLAVVESNAIWIFDCFVGFVFADDPSIEVLVG